MYKVTKQFGTGAQVHCESFKDIKAARSYITDKLHHEAGQKITYRILEWDEELEAFDAHKAKKIESGESNAGGQGKGASFRPTPLNSAPRPPGSPHSWLKDEDDDKKK